MNPMLGTVILIVLLGSVAVIPILFAIMEDINGFDRGDLFPKTPPPEGDPEFDSTPVVKFLDAFRAASILVWYGILQVLNWTVRTAKRRPSEED
jgi:hypothetical protein